MVQISPGANHNQSDQDEGHHADDTCGNGIRLGAIMLHLADQLVKQDNSIN
jgi:hypothetical protein